MGTGGSKGLVTSQGVTSSLQQPRDKHRKSSRRRVKASKDDGPIVRKLSADEVPPAGASRAVKAEAPPSPVASHKSASSSRKSSSQSAQEVAGVETVQGRYRKISDDDALHATVSTALRTSPVKADRAYIDRSVSVESTQSADVNPVSSSKQPPVKNRRTGVVQIPSITPRTVTSQSSLRPVPAPRSGQGRVAAVVARRGRRRGSLQPGESSESSAAAMARRSVWQQQQRSRSGSWDLERFEELVQKLMRRERQYDTATDDQDLPSPGHHHDQLVQFQYMLAGSISEEYEVILITT